MVIKRCLIKRWTLKGYGTNIDKVFNTDSNEVASFSKNGELVILSIIFLNFVGSLHKLLGRSKNLDSFPFFL